MINIFKFGIFYLKNPVDYFTCAGATKNKAALIIKEQNTDIYKINPKIPIINENIDLTNSNS